MIIQDIEQKIWHNGEWCDLETKTYHEAMWVDVIGVKTWGEPILEKEVGAYTTWFADPSTSVMLHYQTIDDTFVECLFRKEGTTEWQTVDLFADKPFPLSTRRVRWFKLEGLQPDTIYETKLKNHRNVHRFKTMPSTLSRGIKAVILSDQMNDEALFPIEGLAGFNTIHDNDIDVIILAGDAVHDDGQRSRVWPIYWDMYFKLERERNLMIPTIMCLGNHDGRVHNADGTFKSLLWVTGGATKNDVLFAYNFFSNLNDLGYGVIDIGDYLSLVFLNSGHTQTVFGTQTTWLQNILSQRANRHILPFMHVAPYPGHYSYSNAVSRDMRDLWTPLFKQYGVKIAANGHEHVHLVTKKVLGDNLDENGVVFTGQGHGMGNITRETNVPLDTWYIDYFNNTQKGFDIIEFKTDGNVDLKKVSLDGDIMYQKTL